MTKIIEPYCVAALITNYSGREVDSINRNNYERFLFSDLVEISKYILKLKKENEYLSNSLDEQASTKYGIF